MTLIGDGNCTPQYPGLTALDAQRFLSYLAAPVSDTPPFDDPPVFNA